MMLILVINESISYVPCFRPPQKVAAQLLVTMLATTPALVTELAELLGALGRYHARE